MIIERRKIWYITSAVLVALSIISVAIFRLNTGIEFTGGTLIEVEGQSSVEEVRSIIETEEIESSTVNSAGDNQFIIRIQSEEQEVQNALSERFENNELNVTSSTSIGASISEDITRNAIIAITLMSVALVFYIAYVFREASRQIPSYMFGIIAVIALLHDATIILGIYAALGQFLGVTIDSFFVTAILTVIGFSVHDTIVVFDRVRENLVSAKKVKVGDFAGVIQKSIEEVFRRSIITSATLIMILGALLVFGGSSIYYFILALLIGAVVGTYSSLFVATPLLVTFFTIKNKD